MSLPLTIYGNAVLRQKGAPIKNFDHALAELVEQMLETMREHKGVGLAAQQIGRALQVAVIDVTGIEDRPSSMIVGGNIVSPEEFMPLYLLNPRLVTTKSKEVGNEGCLSFPGLRIDVPRSRRVTVTTHSLTGTPFTFEAGGLLSIAVQHEFDHLQGKLFIDYLTPAERQEIKPKLAAVERGQTIPPDPEDED